MSPRFTVMNLPLYSCIHVFLYSLILWHFGSYISAKYLLFSSLTKFGSKKELHLCPCGGHFSILYWNPTFLFLTMTGMLKMEGALIISREKEKTKKNSWSWQQLIWYSIWSYSHHYWWFVSLIYLNWWNLQINRTSYFFSRSKNIRKTNITGIYDRCTWFGTWVLQYLKIIHMGILPHLYNPDIFSSCIIPSIQWCVPSFFQNTWWNRWQF